NRQVDALAQAIEEACARKKRRALAVEGTPAAAWVLIDFGDVVVHIFQEEARGLYDIEGLWLDARRLPVPGQGADEAEGRGAALPLVVRAVGKIKEPGLRDVIDEYYDRVRRHYAIEEIELRDGSDAQLVPAFDKRLPAAAHVVALDASGTARASADFAQWLRRHMSQGQGAVAFLLGGADGLPRAIMERAHEKQSLSKMTFSHRLARLVLAEQLYRAAAILHREPYARL